MSDPVRYYLDESVDPRIARALRRLGIDAITTVEAGLRTMADDRQWEFAQSQSRVIVTSDDDFLRRVARDTTHHGLVFFSKDSRSVGEVVDWLILIFNALTLEEMIGQVEFVPSHAPRVH